MAEPNESIQNPQGSQGNPPAGTDGAAAPPAAKPLESPDIQKLIQASEDRIRTQYSKELRAQQTVIDELRTKTMSESDLRKHKEQLLSERESTLARKELDLFAVDICAENDLPISLRPFIVGKDTEDTKARAGTLKTEFQKAVEAAVQERFKQNGRDPAKASELPTGKGRIYSKAEITDMSRKAQDLSVPVGQRIEITKELTTAAREGRIQR